MRIVDAQVHIWSGGTPRGLHRQVPAFTAEELLAEMDAAGVDAAVIHPPVSWDPHSNELAGEAARGHPGRLRGLGQRPPRPPGANPRRLQTRARRAGVVGVC